MDYNYNLVFCTDVNGGISRSGDIPWKINEDSILFKDLINKKITGKKNVLIMGRNTYNKMVSIIKEHHYCIVITNNPELIKENVITINSLDNIDEVISKLENVDNIFVCGGSNIYNYFFKFYFRHNLTIYWTEISNNYKCDNFIQSHIYTFLQNYTDISGYIRLNCNDSSINQIVNVKFYRPFTLNKFFKINEIRKNPEEENYLRIMNKILNDGAKEKCRNGITYSLFGNILTFNLNKFPLLTTKNTFMRGIFEELMFFIKGETDAKILSDKGVKIWDKNTSKSFLEKCNLKYEEGDMGPMYGFQWRHFNAEYKGKDVNYDGIGYDQLSYVMGLLKTDPKSRRIIMTTYNPSMATQGVLFPCHGITIMFHCNNISDNNYTLDLMQTQRSCDYFLGVPFNIASYSLLVYMMCHVLNNSDDCPYKYEPGKLVMNLGDYHLYEEHLNQAKKQILRTPDNFPELRFKNVVNRLEDFKYEDIEIINYNPYPGIIAEMKE